MVSLLNIRVQKGGVTTDDRVRHSVIMLSGSPAQAMRRIGGCLGLWTSVPYPRGELAVKSLGNCR
jgi:hypothetical protein